MESTALLNNSAQSKNNNWYSDLNEQFNKAPKLAYKGVQHMSNSAFETLSNAIFHQKKHSDFLSRSASVGNDIKSAKFNPEGITSQLRRTLYESLPFVAVPGMQHREGKIRKVLSTASIMSMDNLSAADAELVKVLSEVDIDEITVTVPLSLAVVVAIMSQFLVGYNTGVMNSPESVVFPGHTTFEWSLAVASFAVGGPFGSIVGGILANKLGRSGTLVLNTWIFLLGGLLMSFAPSITYLIIARFIIGFASGCSSVVVPVYLGEIAPPTLRGTFGTCTQFALVIGILASDVLAFPFSTAELWRYLFGFTPCIALLQIICGSFLVESPRWLLSNNSNSSLARVAIKQLRGYRKDSDVEAEVENFLCASKKHKTGRTSAHSGGAIWDLLQCREMHVLVVASIVLQMAQQLCGINAVFYYSTTFFQGVISSPLLGTSLIAFVNVVATYAALQLMDNTPRRTLLLWSSGGMLISTVVIVLVLLGYLQPIMSLFAMFLFVSFFEIGLGPIPWLIVAEMFDAKWVATAMALSCIVNWSCNFLVGLCFPFMQSMLGPYSFLPFGFVLLLTFLYIYCCLPETHGRTVEDIQRIAGCRDDEIMNKIEMNTIRESETDEN